MTVPLGRTPTTVYCAVAAAASDIRQIPATTIGRKRNRLVILLLLSSRGSWDAGVPHGTRTLLRDLARGYRRACRGPIATRLENAWKTIGATRGVDRSASAPRGRPL